MNLPWDWPRLNSWPEWFVPDQSVRLAGATGMEAGPSTGPFDSPRPLNLPAAGSAVVTFAPANPTP